MLAKEWRLCIYTIILMTVSGTNSAADLLVRVGTDRTIVQWFNFYSHTSQDSYTTFLRTEKGMNNKHPDEDWCMRRWHHYWIPLSVGRSQTCDVRCCTHQRLSDPSLGPPEQVRKSGGIWIYASVLRPGNKSSLFIHPGSC
jgi:hypothetical protein